MIPKDRRQSQGKDFMALDLSVKFRDLWAAGYQGKIENTGWTAKVNGLNASARGQQI